MKTKCRISRLLDFVLVALFALSTLSIFAGRTNTARTAILGPWGVIHDLAGAWILAVATAHILLHWDWIRAVILRWPTGLRRAVRANRIVDSLLFVSVPLCGVTGVLTWSMALIGTDPPCAAIKAMGGIHMLLGIPVCCVIATHIALHLKRLTSKLRRRQGFVVGGFKGRSVVKG
jgi:hypothetical protein